MSLGKMSILWTPDFGPDVGFVVPEGDPLRHKPDDYREPNHVDQEGIDNLVKRLEPGDHKLAQTLFMGNVGRLRRLTVLARAAVEAPDIDDYEYILDKMTYAKIVGPFVVASQPGAHERIKEEFPDRFQAVYIEPGMIATMVQRLTNESSEYPATATDLASIHWTTLEECKKRSASSVSHGFEATHKMIQDIEPNTPENAERLDALAGALSKLAVAA